MAKFEKNGLEKKKTVFGKKKNKILENRVREWRQTIPRKKKYGTFGITTRRKNCNKKRYGNYCRSILV